MRKARSASRCSSAAVSGARRYIGQTIRKWLAPEHLLSYVEAILRVYNMHGRRDNIHKARIKIIVNQMGIDKYRELVDKEWELTKNGALKVPTRRSSASTRISRRRAYEKLPDQTAELAGCALGDRAFGRWVRDNVVAHKVPGYAIVNVSLKAPGARAGDITADKMDAVADLADRYSFGEIRVTPPAEPRARRTCSRASCTRSGGSSRRSSSQHRTSGSCPTSSAARASTTALSRTRARSRSRKTSAARSRIWTSLHDIGKFTIKISGCMNACGHHHVGHIGILGVDKRGEEFYQLTLGGSSDQHASLGDRLGPGLPQAEVPGAIRKIVDTYRACAQTTSASSTPTGASASSRSRAPSTATMKVDA